MCETKSQYFPHCATVFFVFRILLEIGAYFSLVTITRILLFLNLVWNANLFKLLFHQFTFFRFCIIAINGYFSFARHQNLPSSSICKINWSQAIPVGNLQISSRCKIFHHFFGTFIILIIIQPFDCIMQWGITVRWESRGNDSYRLRDQR